MTLLTKLEDSKEGLVGITEQDERVHLGKPTLYTHLRNYGYTSFKDAVKAFCYQFIGDLQKKVRFARHKELKESFREDQEAYWYIEPDDIRAFSFNDLSFCYAYLRFEKNKEKAYQLKKSSYDCGSSWDPKFIPIHRIVEEKLT